ncbi:MAG: hypothetical protein KGP12_06205 [Actinomycetales bacterium]|nr:hypothetical protein [Actinomycetales bacterium]
MGFYVRVAPGLKLRLTSRGLRASIGPRAARLHVGAGGPGVSTGAGPVSYYHPLRTGSRSGPVARGRAEKLAQAKQVNAIWTWLLNVHQQEFPPAQPPVIARPSVPDVAVLVKEHRKRSVQGISWFRRRARRQAKADALVQARQAWDDANASADAELARLQADADAWWARLLANDPATVLGQLADAFDDNDAPCAPLQVTGSEVSLAMLAPADEAIPDRLGRMTSAGNPSLARLPKGERGQMITAVTCGFVLVTLRETFAVAPGLESARMVVVREAGMDAYGRPRLECVLAGRWLKARFDGVRWKDVDAGTIAMDTADELILDIRGGAPRPLSLADQPDLRELVASIDTSSFEDEPSDGP